MGKVATSRRTRQTVGADFCIRSQNRRRSSGHHRQEAPRLPQLKRQRRGLRVVLALERTAEAASDTADASARPAKIISAAHMLTRAIA